MNKLILTLFVLATIMPYEAFARGDGGSRLEKRAGYGAKVVRQKRVATKVVRKKPVATKAKRGRTYGFTASAGKTCGTYMYWKDGRCQDARDKRPPWKAF